MQRMVVIWKKAILLPCFGKYRPKQLPLFGNLTMSGSDEEWMAKRKASAGQRKPYSVYEVHIGSWKKKAGGSESLSYRELADELVPYVKKWASPMWNLCR